MVTESQIVSNTHYPKWLIDFYKQTIHEFGFATKSEAIQYLIEGLWNKQNGIQNSEVVDEILRYVKRKKCTFFAHAECGRLGVLLSPDTFNKLEQIKGFSCRSRKIQALIEAFLSCKTSDKRLLQKEIHLKRRCLPFTKSRLDTYVQHETYHKLEIMAQRLDKKVCELIHLVIDVLIRQEDTEFEFFYVPKEVKQALQDVLLLEGSTLKRFKRGRQICIYITDPNIRTAISNIIYKYEIPGPCEFLRRVIIFLMDSSDLMLKQPSSISEEENIMSLHQDDNDLYLNLARKDFYYSKYRV